MSTNFIFGEAPDYDSISPGSHDIGLNIGAYGASPSYDDEYSIHVYAKGDYVHVYSGSN